MSTISTRFSTVARALPATIESPAQSINERLSVLYGLAQRSNYVFGSPLGPGYHHGRHFHLPRFVYFGPFTSDDSLRLAFLSGFDGADLRGTLALLHFIERLALTPDLGQGLNLSFFPLVDVLGQEQALVSRGLADTDWAYAEQPEIDLLQKDARVRGYHGFVRIETGRNEEVITVRLRGDATESTNVSGVELISSEDFDPLPVRWEADALQTRPADGPLTLLDDLPFRPFELTVKIPAAWPADLHREAVTSILKRFILRYRALQAYGQHL